MLKTYHIIFAETEKQTFSIVFNLYVTLDHKTSLK